MAEIKTVEPRTLIGGNIAKNADTQRGTIVPGANMAKGNTIEASRHDQ